MAILIGIVESNFPVSGEKKKKLAPLKELQTPLEVFLPRLCRTIPHETIRTIRTMSDDQINVLSKRLCVWELPAPQAGETPIEDTRITQVFRIIAAEADGGGVSTKGGRYIRLMKKVLTIHLNASEEVDQDEGEDDATIARAFLAVADML